MGKGQCQGDMCVMATALMLLVHARLTLNSITTSRDYIQGCDDVLLNPGD